MSIASWPKAAHFCVFCLDTLEKFVAMIDVLTFLFEVKKRSILPCLLLITYNLCLAQENIRFERISVNEGLSQADIKSIVQDKLGFLWVGTRDGLNRYDGAKFIRYNRRENDSTSLYFNQ